MSVIGPTSFDDVEQLESQLSAPTPGVLETFRKLQGDVVILGVGGKMGPTLARMAKRASEQLNSPRRIIGVSRFSDNLLRTRLETSGVETISCDLLDENQVERLPEAPTVISMAGFKFGASSNPSLTWAMNCHLPAIVCQRYQASRIVAFSSGNVYGLAAASSAGSIESDEPRPVGEYAMSVLGRERMFEYFSQKLSIPVVLLRLNYATEVRYGVLVDLAKKVWNQEPIDLSMGYVNVIWQSDANAMSLQSIDLAKTPAKVLNIAGNEILRVRDLADRFGKLMGRRVQFIGQEASESLINNAGHSHQLFGAPKISSDQMIQWTACWIQSGGMTLNKATHFQSRDGRF